MRGCRMSRPWCWCPGNVWTSESEECLHSGRVGAGAGIILRLRLRSTPALAVNRDPFTEELSQATSGQWSVNTDAIIILTSYLIRVKQKREQCVKLGFVPRRRHIICSLKEVEWWNGFEHQMCIGDISMMKNESYETFQFIGMYLSCSCCFNSISTTHTLTFKNNITSNEIKINQHSSTSTSHPMIRLDSIWSLSQCILPANENHKHFSSVKWCGINYNLSSCHRVATVCWLTSELHSHWHCLMLFQISLDETVMKSLEPCICWLL